MTDTSPTAADLTLAAQYADACRELARITTDSPHGDALTIMDAPALAILGRLDFAALADLLARLGEGYRMTDADYARKAAEDIRD